MDVRFSSSPAAGDAEFVCNSLCETVGRGCAANVDPGRRCAWPGLWLFRPVGHCDAELAGLVSAGLSDALGLAFLVMAGLGFVTLLVTFTVPELKRES